MGSAIPEERRLVIMEHVRSRPLVKPAELADELASRSRPYGATSWRSRRTASCAVSTAAPLAHPPRAFEPAFEKRRMLHRERKAAIGRLAAESHRARRHPDPRHRHERRRAGRRAAARLSRHRPHQLAAGGQRAGRPRGRRGDRRRAAGCAPATSPVSGRSARPSSATTSPTRRSWARAAWTRMGAHRLLPRRDRLAPRHPRARGGALRAGRLLEARRGGLRQGVRPRRAERGHHRRPRRRAEVDTPRGGGPDRHGRHAPKRRPAPRIRRREASRQRL